MGIIAGKWCLNCHLLLDFSRWAKRQRITSLDIVFTILFLTVEIFTTKGKNKIIFIIHLI